MAMEHRWSERKPIHLDVTLTYAPVGRIQGRTRDVSLEGMFVETSGINIPRHAEIEVEVTTSETQGTKVHRFPAYVVHGREDGVGLMLRHVAYNDFNALRYVLNAA